MEKSTQRLSTTQYKQECEKVERIINRLESSDPDFDDCNDAVVLLRKYKKLCREIGRGDSYHLGRIDSAIQGLESPQAASSAQQARIAELEALSDDLLNTLNFERGQHAKLKKDADRYRWLRRDYGKSHIHVISYSIENEAGDLLMGADCDYAIDVAMEDRNANN